jgi:hypothetical protein
MESMRGPAVAQAVPSIAMEGTGSVIERLARRGGVRPVAVSEI